MAEMQPLVPTNGSVSKFKLPQGKKLFKCERPELLNFCESKIVCFIPIAASTISQW